MSEIILGIGDIGVTKDQGSIIKTFALGSCVAVILYHRRTHTGGMVHIALASSNINEAKSLTQPGYFADTALPELFRMMQETSGYLDLNELQIKLVGGASILEDKKIFNIGATNVAEIKKILSNQGLAITAEDTGGEDSRTVSISVDDGKIVVSNYKKGKWEI